MSEAHTAPANHRQELIAFLQSPSSYPHRPKAVRSTETHISWVFVASPFVFKVKKPVDLGFADFSTLEKRRYFCSRELELNRRLCPEIYLGVLPISESGAGFSFATHGRIVEYALQMQELPPEYFLNELLARDAVGEAEISRIVRRLHQFYTSQTPPPEIEQLGKPENLRVSTEENFAQIESFVGKTISPLVFETLRHFTNTFFVRNNHLFEERIEHRRILDCHGDLRLDHINLTPDAVTIFDCVEFNDRFRFIDIANDLAFLAMDFDFAHRPDLAKLFLQNAARTLNDGGLLPISNFYKCYRAVVRGKVESIQAISQPLVNAEEHARRAERYFQCGLRYSVAGSEPLLLVIMGGVATGKTTIAQQLARELNWPVFSSDRIRKELAGVSLGERSAPELRAKVYSEEMTRQTYCKLIEEALSAARTRGGVIVDATFSKQAYRDLLRRESSQANLHFQFIELRASREEIANRLAQREKIRGEISDARLEDLERLSAAYQSPTKTEMDIIRISAAGSVFKSARAVLLRLAEIPRFHPA